MFRKYYKKGEKNERNNISLIKQSKIAVLKVELKNAILQNQNFHLESKEDTLEIKQSKL